jgi:hypothetical protein
MLQQHDRGARVCSVYTAAFARNPSRSHGDRSLEKAGNPPTEHIGQNIIHDNLGYRRRAARWPTRPGPWHPIAGSDRLGVRSKTYRLSPQSRPLSSHSSMPRPSSRALPLSGATSPPLRTVLPNSRIAPGWLSSAWSGPRAHGSGRQPLSADSLPKGSSPRKPRPWPAGTRLGWV